MFDTQVDFVVVGAGSAGCVLAARLSENPANQVLVLEYGGRDNSIFIRMPSACAIPMTMKRFDWQFMTEPEPGLGGRQIHQARGKVLGGTSSINGMCYVRGHPGDFDQWARSGATGWDYAHCLPYFRRSESCSYGGDAYRGDAGPLHVGNGNNMRNPLYRAFIEAGVEAGYQSSADVNGHQQDGFGRMDMTVKDGLRWSTSVAYLKPAMRRHNLRVETNALTQRVLFEGKRAVGVEYERGGRVWRVAAREEVILCAGPFNSPKILMLSGVGPGEHLREHGIDCLFDLPAVGANLHDHLGVWFQYHCTQPISLNGKLNVWSKFLIGLNWLLFKRGLGATSHYESNAYIRSGPGVRFPDIQYHFLPAAMVFDGSSTYAGHGFGAQFSPSKPSSRGTVRLRTSEARHAPVLRFNYLQDEDDLRYFRIGTRLTREIVSQPAFDPYRGVELRPGEDVREDDEIDDWVRQNAKTQYHPCGTCRMGSDDSSVVDPETRVRGVSGLRVVDSSIMPIITNGNLNAPTIMLAEKAADLIIGREPLPPSPVPAYFEPAWESVQRSGQALRATSSD